MKTKNFFIISCVCFLPLIAFGQKSDKKSGKKITITGTVLSLDKKPVAGAVIYIDSVKTSNKSRNDGSYKIKVSPAAHKLMVRSTEFGYAETSINGQSSINFILDGVAEKPNVKSSDDGKQKDQPESGFRIANPKAKKMITYTDIYQMIRAEVRGVVVSGKSVMIEQGHSFFGDSVPLFVVNGTIVSSIDNIDPREVKSINVLKGSSAVIYGVQGSNGVISITLKNGSEREK